MKNRTQTILLLAVPVVLSGCSGIRSFSHQMGMPAWLTWTLIVLVLLGICAIAAVIGEKHFRRHEEELKALADGLGMQYTNLKPNDADYLAWKITGLQKGRNVRIEQVRRGGSGQRQSLMLVSASCKGPPELHGEMGYRSFLTAEPTHTLEMLKPQGDSTLADRNIYASVQGPLAPETIAQLRVGGILRDAGMREVGLRLKPDGVHLYYDRRPETLNRDAGFVRLAVESVLELAEYAERSGSGR